MIWTRILAQLFVLSVCAVALAAFFRFDVVAAGSAGGSIVFRLDRLTGAISVCLPKAFPRYVCE